MRRQNPFKSQIRSVPLDGVQVSQSIGASKVSFHYKNYNQPFNKLPNSRPIYSHTQTIPSNNFPQFYSPTNNSRQYFLHQDLTLKQNPPVSLNPNSNINQNNHIPAGLGLPYLPALTTPQQKNIIEKNNPKNTSQNKFDICCLVPWIIAALLLIALIVVSILLILNKVHHNYVVNKNFPCQMRSRCEPQQNLSLQNQNYAQIKNLKYKDPLGETDTQRQDLSGPNWQFNKVDHTNYEFVYLRRNLISINLDDFV